jgi:hypothetical protein
MFIGFWTQHRPNKARARASLEHSGCRAWRDTCATRQQQYTRLRTSVREAPVSEAGRSATVNWTLGADSQRRGGQRPKADTHYAGPCGSSAPETGYHGQKAIERETRLPIPWFGPSFSPVSPVAWPWFLRGLLRNARLSADRNFNWIMVDTPAITGASYYLPGR